MLEALKEFISGLGDEGHSEVARGEADARLAAAALLFHIADLDGIVQPSETAKLRALLAERFGLDQAQTSRLVADARRIDREAVDLFHFTTVLKRSLDHAGLLKVLEMMWEIAFADGRADELEENTIWRVAELLGVSSRERIGLRQRVSEQAAAEPTTAEDSPAPWGRADPQ
ncbi:MAG TPA: TerB family tellurite resistance protein [Beijerinckiaceae bacterium]|nr:TerB family tellurite resistance protein [Beijerinckiaceae bacterium]